MYTPGLLGNYDDEELKALVVVLRQELEAISQAFVSIDSLELQELNVEPQRVFTGLTVLADGTNWNPGAGQGVYTYYNNTWNRLG